MAWVGFVAGKSHDGAFLQHEKGQTGCSRKAPRPSGLCSMGNEVLATFWGDSPPSQALQHPDKHSTSARGSITPDLGCLRPISLPEVCC